MIKSINEINEKIKAGKAVVMTAKELKEKFKANDCEEVLAEVDVVTTSTFSPMCSSGAFINFGHPFPGIRMEKLTLDGVDAYGGIAAVDAYIGATQESNTNIRIGGAHIIYKLIKGEKVLLKATGKGTDCYPRKEIETYIDKDSINEFFLFNPRNCYQNYRAAINSSDNDKFTYMGKLISNNGNINYCTSGEISPLLNDLDLETIGIGTKIWFCGAEGFVAFGGTQSSGCKPKNEFGVPLSPSLSLALIGNAKEMNHHFIKPIYLKGYGVSLALGIGIPIPVINKKVARNLLIRNKQINTEIADYGNYIEKKNQSITFY